MAVIDTATINYGFTKISAAIQTALPTLTDVSQKVVTYQVTLAILNPIFTGLWIIALMVAIRWFHKKEIEDATRGMRSAYSEPSAPAIAVWILGIVTFCFSVSFFCELQSLVLAVTNPEVYTVMKMIGK